MKTIKTYISPLFIIVLLFSPLGASYKKADINDPDFFTYTDTAFKFSILIPKNWKKEDIDLSYKHILILSGKDDSAMKVTVSQIDDEEEDKWSSWEEWFINNGNISLKNIVDEKGIKLQKNITGKFLVFQYQNSTIKILNRILLARFNNNLLVIECRAPVQSFYRYDGIFDIVMSSLKTM